MNDMPYDYAEFLRRAGHAARRRRTRRRTLAATVVGMVLLLIGATWYSRSAAESGRRGAAPGALALAAAQRSRAAPPLLTDPPAAPALVLVASGMAASRLEDRIAALDDQLNEAQFGGDTLASIHSLRNERMQLVDSLVRVRYAERLAAAVR